MAIEVWPWEPTKAQPVTAPDRKTLARLRQVSSSLGRMKPYILAFNQFTAQFS